MATFSPVVRSGDDWVPTEFVPLPDVPLVEDGFTVTVVGDPVGAADADDCGPAVDDALSVGLGISKLTTGYAPLLQLERSRKSTN